MLAWGMTRSQRDPVGADRETGTRIHAAAGQGRTLGLASADLNGEVSLVNVFASWCTACRERASHIHAVEGQGYRCHSWAQLQGPAR